MQIELQLSKSDDGVLAFDYYHELASAFYRALERFRPEMARDLHDGSHRSRIKLFVFSPLNSDPKPQVAQLPDGTPALKFGSRIWMRFASIWPEMVYHLAEALQKEKYIEVRGQRFRLESLQMISAPEFIPTMTYRPFGQSGCIVCPYNLDGKTHYQLPDDSETDIPGCRELLTGNLRHKLLRLREIRPDIFENILSIGNLDAAAIQAMPIKIEFLPLMANHSFRTRLFRLKGHNVRGFRAPVRITAPEAIHRLVWDCGLGAMNSMGFGMVELGRNESCC